jgi:hypothetical protein
MGCFFRILKGVHWFISKVCPPEKRYQNVHINNLPWFWIGGCVDDNQIGITDLVNKSIKNGSIVTPKFLSELSGYNEPVKWKYIDAVTLEEKEFPPSGIVIKNGSQTVSHS